MKDQVIGIIVNHDALPFHEREALAGYLREVFTAR